MVKYTRCRPKAKGEATIYIIVILPVDPEEVPVFISYRYVAKCTFDVDFCQFSIASKLVYYLNCIINGEVLLVNSVIDAAIYRG